MVEGATSSGVARGCDDVVESTACRFRTAAGDDAGRLVGAVALAGDA